MHELSIALGIVKIAEDEIAKTNATKVDIIELEIGTLAGIEFDSLDFVWPSAVKDTSLEFAQRKIKKIKPKCQSFLKGILQGKELRVKALEVS